MATETKTQWITDAEKADVMSHLKYWGKNEEPSEAALRVAVMLNQWDGLHHFDADEMKKANWTNPRFVSIVFRFRAMATFDFDDLTRLVFLAHDHCIRIDIRGSGANKIEVLFHPRESRDGAYQSRHPTIERAIAQHRKSGTTRN